MVKKSLQDKLAILSDAAKYDASCASSGGEKRDASKGGVGSSGGAGICHAYTPDGRCISLLKILMTNFCIFDCAYCINRAARTWNGRGSQSRKLSHSRWNFIDAITSRACSCPRASSSPPTRPCPIWYASRGHCGRVTASAAISISRRFPMQVRT